MKDTETAFERDRRVFVGLLDDILHRIVGGRGYSRALPIRERALRVEHLELAERLGFPAPPLKFRRQVGERDDFRYENYWCDWVDPTGFDGGQAITFTFRSNTDGREERDDHLNGDSGEILAVVMRDWIRALNSLEKPAMYPQGLRSPHPNLDPDLARDPLWRNLCRGIQWLDAEENFRQHSIGYEFTELWVPKINALVLYDGLSDEAIIKELNDPSHPQAFCVEHPLRRKATVFYFRPDWTMAKRTPERLKSAITRWRDARERQLKMVVSKALALAPGTADTVERAGVVGSADPSGRPGEHTLEGSRPTRRKLPSPSAEGLKSGIARLREMDPEDQLNPTDVMKIYGLVGIAVKSFMQSSMYVARDEEPKPHQLPRVPGAGRQDDKGRFKSTAHWSRDQVLAAALGQAEKLGIDAKGPF